MRYPEPDLLHKIPDSLSFEAAALVEPTANAVSDVQEREVIKPGDFVVVIGPGPIGLLAAMAAKAAGASKVAVVGAGRHEKLRLPVARKIDSIDHVINIEKEDPLSFVMDMTEGRGADLVIEASGAPSGIASAFQLVRKLGRITAIGLTGKEKIEIPYDTGMFKAVELTFNLSTSYTSWDKAIRLIDSKKIDIQPLITHKGVLDNWNGFFTDLENGKGIKCLFLP